MVNTSPFKIYLQRADGSNEIRRFCIEKNAFINDEFGFHQVCDKIRSLYPTLRNQSFTIHWIDEEEDKIAVSCDDEYNSAITTIKKRLPEDMPVKLYVIMDDIQREFTESSTSMEGEGTPAKVSRQTSEELKPMDSDPSVVNNEYDTKICEEAMKGEGAGLDNPRPSGSPASGPLASDSLASGPLASDSLASGPLASGPLASGPLASDSLASGPLASGPLASGPLASGPLASDSLASSSHQAFVCHSCYGSLDGRPLFKCGTCLNHQMCADCVNNKSHEHVMIWIPSLQALSSSDIFVDRLKKQARRQTVTNRFHVFALIMPLADNFNLSLFRGLRTRMTGQTATSCDRIISRKMGNAVAGLTATNCDLTFKHNNMRLAVKVQNATTCHRPVSCVVPTTCDHLVSSEESAVAMDAAKGKEDEKEREKMMKKQEKEAKKKEKMLLKKEKKREEKKKCKEVMKLLKNVPHPAFRSTYTTDAVNDASAALLADPNIPLDKKHYFPVNKKSERSQPQEEAEQREVTPEWGSIVFGQKITGSKIEVDVIASLEKIIFGNKVAGKNSCAVKVANNNSDAAKVADDNSDAANVADNLGALKVADNNSDIAKVANDNSLLTDKLFTTPAQTQFEGNRIPLTLLPHDNLNATKVAENNSGAVKVASNKNSGTTEVADDNSDAANVADNLGALKVADNNSDTVKVADDNSLLTDKQFTTPAQTQFEGSRIPLTLLPEEVVEMEEVVTCSLLPDELDWAFVDPITTEEIPKHTSVYPHPS